MAEKEDEEIAPVPVVPFVPLFRRGGDVIQNILNALEGVTVLEKPRVSRETMIEVSRENACLIKEMRSELAVISSLSKSLASEAASNKKELEQLSESAKQNQIDISKLLTYSKEFRIDINSLRASITDLQKLKPKLEEQGDAIVKLTTRFEKHTTEVSDYIAQTNHAVNNLDKNCEETQFKLKELKEYVDHFGDNLILGANQITVDVSAGFSMRPLNLLDILKQCSGNFTDLDETLTNHDKDIKDNAAAVATKADDTVLFNVDTLESKVEFIEAYLKKEEEQGVSAIRRSCEELTEQVESIQFQLMDKVGQEAVDNIVHKKYEDIVQYLQDALSSTSEDENNFKQKATDLELLVNRLQNSKADRVEIVPMQEMLVKAEAMLSNNKSSKSSSKDSYSKKDVEAFLELKVDKATFEASIQQLEKKSKKNRKLSSITDYENYAQSASILGGNFMSQSADSGQMHQMQQIQQYDINNMKGVDSRGDSRGGGDRGSPSHNVDEYVDNSTKDAAMWKGITNALKSESEQAINRSSVNHNRGGVGGGNNSTEKNGQTFGTVKGKKVSVTASRTSANFPSNNQSAPGSFRVASEGNRGGSQVDNSGRQQVDHSGRQIDPRIEGNSSNNNQQQHIQGQIPIEFIEGMPQGGNGVSPDLSYLGAPMTGGGFNRRGGGVASKSHQSLKPIGMDTEEDIEGNGLLMKGRDGHLYYSDDPTSHAENQQGYQPQANAKKMPLSAKVPNAKMDRG
jgi:hypothetical protein